MSDVKHTVTQTASQTPSETRERRLDQIIEAAVEHHGAVRDAVIPILHEINAAFGFVPTEALGKIRRVLNRPEEGLFLADSQLFAITSFYQMFSLKQTGRHIVRYCASAPCHVVGGRQVIHAVKECLGLGPGQTGVDGQFTLLETSCLGICAVGPVILVDDDIYGNLTPERIPWVLAKYR
jgi:NADH:ubiquinone oxidoreductase subunit E